MKKVLFLDIDGVLTTESSRSIERPAQFSPKAVQVVEHLIEHGKPDLVVIHSFWRKKPRDNPEWSEQEREGHRKNFGFIWSLDLFKKHCRSEGMVLLPGIAMEEVPSQLHASRGQEIFLWLEKNHRAGYRYVCLDDDVSTIKLFVAPRYSDSLLIVETNDETGLTIEQAERAMVWWNDL